MMGLGMGALKEILQGFSVLPIPPPQHPSLALTNTVYLSKLLVAYNNGN